jgi:hypothetical protein
MEKSLHLIARKLAELVGASLVAPSLSMKAKHGGMPASSIVKYVAP